jgi:hypothetical protein
MSLMFDDGQSLLHQKEFTGTLVSVGSHDQQLVDTTLWSVLKAEWTTAP